MSEFCSSILKVYPVGTFNTGIVMLLLGISYLLTSLSTIYFIKLQEYYAKVHMNETSILDPISSSRDSAGKYAVKSNIFPVFVLVLWVNILVNIYVFFVALTLPFDTDTEQSGVASSWAFSIM